MEESAPHKPITSRENSAVKYLKSLADPKRRKKERAFIIEGTKMVEEAIRDMIGVRLLVASPSITKHHGKGVIKLAESRSVKILWISERLMDAVSESKTPQPVMAVVDMKESNERELLSHGSKLIVIAHRLQDPGNLGTIIRTAEAVGASGVAVTHDTVDPYGYKAVRASMGSILRLPVARIGDAADFIGKCRQAGFQIVALDLRGGKTLYDLNLKPPTVVIVGQEGAGLPEDILKRADLRVRIPMADTIDSLNTAVSVSVFLYEAMRQRMRRQ